MQKKIIHFSLIIMMVFIVYFIIGCKQKKSASHTIVSPRIFIKNMTGITIPDNASNIKFYTESLMVFWIYCRFDLPSDNMSKWLSDIPMNRLLPLVENTSIAEKLHVNLEKKEWWKFHKGEKIEVAESSWFKFIETNIWKCTLNIYVIEQSVNKCTIYLQYYEEPFSNPNNEPWTFSKVNIDKLAEISLGDNYWDIIKILGLPSFEQTLIEKNKPSIVAKDLVYIFSQQDSKKLNQQTDSYLKIYFDIDDKIIKIERNNIKPS